MLKKILATVFAASILVTSCQGVFAATETDTETVWSDEYIPNGSFEDTTDYSAKANATLVTTTDEGHGSKVLSVNKGGYAYFTKYSPNQDSTVALNQRKHLIDAVKAGGKLKFEFDVKPATDDTLTQLRIMLRTSSSGEFGARYLVPAECTIDGTVQSSIFSHAKTNAGTTNLSLTGGQWYHFCLIYDFNGIADDSSSAFRNAETDGFWTFLGVNGNKNGEVTLFDNISVKTAEPSKDNSSDSDTELPPFVDTPTLAAGVSAATDAEIASLGTLPEGIGDIYKATLTVGSGNTSTVDLLYYPNALVREGKYDLKVFLFEPTTNPETDGTGLHRMLRYSRYSESHAWKGDIAYVLYDQNANMGVWNTYNGTIALNKTDDKTSPLFSSERIGFRWNIGNDGWSSMSDKYPDAVGKTATVYFSISLTAGVVPDSATAKIVTTKWSGSNLFDEAAYKASSNASVATVDSETVISAGSNYTLVQSALDLTWDPSALYRITYKAKGDGASTYSTDAKVHFRTPSATEFIGTIPASDLATGSWNEYSMICDMSSLERTFKDGTGMLCDRGTADWWLMLRRGSSTEGPVYYKDIVFEKAVETNTGETPVYTSGIFEYKNNTPNTTVSIPTGTLILATYNQDGSFVSAVTKRFSKTESTVTLKKTNTADSDTYEGKIGGIPSGTTGAARIDIEGYDSTKTYKLYVWDSLTGMNSLFGVTATK